MSDDAGAFGAGDAAFEALGIAADLACTSGFAVGFAS